MSRSKKDIIRSEARALLSSMDVDELRGDKACIRAKSKGKTPMAGATVTPEMYSAITQAASRLNVNRSDIVRAALERYLEVIQ